MRRLAEVNAYVLFQLDSVDQEKTRVLRGNEMTRYRDQGLANLEKYDVDTSILMTVIKGLNDDEIGSLLLYALTTGTITRSTPVCCASARACRSSPTGG